MRALLLLVPSLFLACEPADPKLDGDDTGGSIDSGDTADTQDTQDTEDTSDTSDTEDTSDTQDTEETGDPAEVTISDLTWRLHPDIESMVYVSWVQEGRAMVHVEYSFDDGVWMQSPPFDAGSGVNEQILVGIPFETTASWRVVVDGGTSVDGAALTTGDLPRGIRVPSVTRSDDSQWLSWGNYLLCSMNEDDGGWTGGTYWTFILDREGRLVWANETPDRHWTLYATVAQTRDHILWDEATYWSDWDDGSNSKIHRTYLDFEIDTVSTPGLHHAFVQLPDGTLAWGSQDHGGHEALVERGPSDSDERIIWTCQEDWPNSGRSCESNGLFYVPETNTYLYSFYTNNSMVEVDREAGTSWWWAGEVPDGYTFDPASSQYSWQHGVSYTDSGTLLVSSEYSSDGRRYETWLMEYEVDHENETLHYVWGSGAGVYASTNGDAWRLENGNTLHVVGAAGVIREVNPAGEDVWRLEYGDDYLLGRGEFIEDLYTLVSPR